MLSSVANRKGVKGYRLVGRSFNLWKYLPNRKYIVDFECPTLGATFIEGFYRRNSTSLNEALTSKDPMYIPLPASIVEKPQ